MPPTIRGSLSGCALALGIGLSGHAAAQDLVRAGYGYGGRDIRAAGYGYGTSLVSADLVGMPLARPLRPTELVPSAWGYGTYGVPTVTGIRPAPVGSPAFYVIDTPPKAVSPRGERQTRAVGSHRASRRKGHRMSASEAAPAVVAIPGGSRIVTIGVGHMATR